MLDFARWLQAELELKRMRPAELARRAGVSKQNIGKILNRTPHSLTGTIPNPKVETVDAIAKALGSNQDEARIAAGYAPSNLPVGKPKDLPDLLKRLEDMGVENLHFYDEDRLRDASPEQLQDMLESISLAIRLTIEKQARSIPPTHDLHDTPR